MTLYYEEHHMQITPKCENTQFSLSPIRKKYRDVMFPGAMWDRAVATSFPAHERG